MATKRNKQPHTESDMEKNLHKTDDTLETLFS